MSLCKIGIMVEVAKSESEEDRGSEEEDLDIEAWPASSTSLCIIMYVSLSSHMWQSVD